jgi:hypothetical protein
MDVPDCLTLAIKRDLAGVVMILCFPANLTYLLFTLKSNNEQHAEAKTNQAFLRISLCSSAYNFTTSPTFPSKAFGISGGTTIVVDPRFVQVCV